MVKVKTKNTDPDISVEKSTYYDNHIKLLEGQSSVGSIALSDDVQPSMTYASQVVLPYLDDALTTLKEALQTHSDYTESEINDILDAFESGVKHEDDERTPWLQCPECKSKTCIIVAHDDGLGYSDYELICENGHYVFVKDEAWFVCPHCDSSNVTLGRDGVECKNCGKQNWM